jgi:hypothetical protein
VINGRLLPFSRWPEALEQLVNESVRQRLHGLPPLSRTTIRYQREKKGSETFKSAIETYRDGHGDCEDLSIYLAADLRVAGIPAHVVIRPSTLGYHALVGVGRNGNLRLFDPSRARGMK